MSIVEKIGDLKRFDHIINIFFKYEFGYLIEKLRLKDRLTLHQRLQKSKFEPRAARADMLRKVFEEIGGAFIKLGQFLSLRPDIVPIEYVKEFEKLQDRVPAFSFEEVRKTIEDSLNVPMKEVFKEFHEKPVASASIAQVHKAKLVSGEEVAVKVQRPKIREIMKRDIDLMMYFANHMIKHNHKIKGVNPVLIVNEFKRWTEKELDFEQEASNIEIFRNNFEKDKNVIIPKVYEKYSKGRILVMEFIEGVELNNIEEVKEKGYDVDSILKIGLNSILKQVFVDGFFHADPHPGNVLVIDSDRIAFVDFGIVGIFDDEMKDAAANLFSGIIKNDVDKVLDTLIEMGVDVDDKDILKIEIESKIKKLQGSELQDVVISEVLEDIIGIVQKHGFKVPIDFVLFGKTIMTLEGLALKYDPEFRITVQSRDFVKKLMKRNFNPKQIMKKVVNSTEKIKDFAGKIPERTNYLMKKVKETNLNLRYIDRDMRSLVMEMDKSSNRVVFGLIITALIIASTIMLGYDEIQIMNMSAFSFMGFATSGLLVLVLIASMFKEKRY
jgi:ubiquinone biosynthesis protein